LNASDGKKAIRLTTIPLADSLVTQPQGIPIQTAGQAMEMNADGANRFDFRKEIIFNKSLWHFPLFD